MKILIAGGLGYLGGRIASYLKGKKPDSEILLTSRDIRKPLPEWAKDFSVLQMDLLDKESIKKCINDSRADLIIHLAALNEIDSIKNPDLALQVNTIGTYKLLESAAEAGIDDFIYFSTFHVYGNIADSKISEEAPTKPAHPYAITHRVAEDLVNYFRQYKKIKTLILRLSNGYGYPMDQEIDRWTLVFNDLCRQVVATGKIILKSSGKQQRDFISLHDVSRAVYHFIFEAKEKWQDGIFNLGGECSISIFDVAQKIAQIYKKKYKKSLPEIVRGQEGKTLSNFQAIRYSIEKLKKTGFKLTNEMDKEIIKTMEICEEFIK